MCHVTIRGEKRKRKEESEWDMKAEMDHGDSWERWKNPQYPSRSQDPASMPNYEQHIVRCVCPNRMYDHRPFSKPVAKKSIS
jgi:hypothetical protein